MFSGNTDNFGSKEQKLFGLDEKRGATAEQARPVPYFAGRRILGVTWISDVYNIIAVPQSSGMKKAGGTSSYLFYIQIAGLLCHGPVDRLHKIKWDGKVVWEGLLIRDGSNPDSVEITVENRGTFRLYWGTETQPLDATLTGEFPELGYSGANQSAYRGQCYFNCQVLLEEGRREAPQFEFEVSRYPSIAWLTPEANINDDCNPIHFIAELAQNQRFGAGLPNSRLSTARLNIVAQQLYNEGFGLSPLLNRQIGLKEFLIEALQYFDGYREERPDGKFSIGLNRGQDSSGGEIPVIGVEDLLDAPEVEPPSWDETVNHLWVSFSNRELDFQSDAVSYINRANRQIVGRPLPQTVDRSWCTYTPLALRIAAATGRQKGIPITTGRGALLKASADTLSVGKQFMLCYPPRQLNLMCKVTEKNFADPSKPRCDIMFEVDRGYLNADDLFIPAPEPVQVPQVYAPAPVTKSLIIECPYGVRSDAYQNGIGFVVSRPAHLITSTNVHQKNPSGSYAEIIHAGGFGFVGKLQEDYAANTNMIDDEIGMLIKLSGIDKTLPNFPLEDALTNEYLIFVGGEIMSMFEATLEDTDTYRVYAIRNRYDTRRLAHQAFAEAFLVQRAAIPSYAEAGELSPATYKLQPVLLSTPLDLADADAKDLNLTFRGQRPWAPKNLYINGSATNPTYATDADVTVEWSDVTPDPSLADVPPILFQVRSAENINSVVHQEIIAAGVEGRVLTNGEIIGWFGDEETFNVRIYHQRTGGWKSRDYLQLQVTKI